ncbi:MAG: T9SS type A sorting domain-containing protein [Rhodothermales bacterium]
MKPIPFRLLILLLWASLGTAAIAQNSGSLPEYQVIFDDFDYDATGYPEAATGELLFGLSSWHDRSGDNSFKDQAWYYYQWRWHALGRTIHPSAAFKLNNNESGSSLQLEANAGYTRQYDIPNTVPIQMQSGFLRETGSWSVNARFDDLELIPYFTQAFWIISPVASSKERTGIAQWSEFNFEWQNWFALDLLPDSTGIDSLLSNDVWAPGNLWVDELGYEGQPFPEGELPALNTRTYMANGIHMYGFSVGAAFETGETAGGIPLRNELAQDPAPFTCSITVDQVVTNIANPITCMNFIAPPDDVERWVQLTIQYDGKDALFSMFTELDEQGSFLSMSSRAPLNERSLPLLVTLGMHPPNREIVLAEGETSVLEIDWFYYSPNSKLTDAEIRDDVKAFRARNWPRVNLDQEKLSHGELTPWRIEEFTTPTNTHNNWEIRPNMRLTNGIEVQWNYRSRDSLDEFYSAWSGWTKAGFKYALPETPYEAEVDVRIKDHNSGDHDERSFWANASCIRYNYVTKTSSTCTGGEEPEKRRSGDQLPGELILDQIYPNPVKSEATIRVGFRIQRTFELLVFDTQGRERVVISSGELPAGYHLIKWNPQNLASGQYFLALRTDKDVRSIPFTVVK